LSLSSDTSSLNSGSGYWLDQEMLERAKILKRQLNKVLKWARSAIL
jgi:hypothetical protein